MSEVRTQRSRPRLGRTALILELLVAGAFVAFVITQSDWYVPPLTDRYFVEAELTDAGGAKTADDVPVSIAGAPAGKVSKIRYENGRAIATLRLTPADVARKALREDARVVIVIRAVQNALFYDIEPGRSPRQLPPGKRIPQRQTAPPVRADEVISTLDANTRAYLQVLLGELSVGLRNRSTPLRRALATLDAATAPTVRVTRALAERRRLLARLVRNIDVLFGALGDRRIALANAISAGERTLAATAARDRELASTVRRLPATLTSLDSALTATARLSVPLNPALERLRPAARALPGVLRETRELVPTARLLLADAAPVVRRGRRPIADLRRILEDAIPISRQLAPAAADALAALRAVDSNRAGIPLLGENAAGAVSTNDSGGPLLRTLAFFEPVEGAAFGRPGATGPSLDLIRARVALALDAICQEGNSHACMARALAPELPTPEAVDALPPLEDVAGIRSRR